MGRKDGDGDDGENANDADQKVDLSPSSLLSALPISLELPHAMHAQLATHGHVPSSKESAHGTVVSSGRASSWAVGGQAEETGS